MDSDSMEEVILCPRCNAQMRIQRTDKHLQITCPHCYSVFFHNIPRRVHGHMRKFIWAIILIGLIVVIYWRSQNASISANWVTISYGGLVNQAILTHSGEPVGDVIRNMREYQSSSEIKGLVQTYLEPYSLLCHDVLLAVTGPDTLPLINIISHYPVGSEQPAWAALFREGHYQVYYSAELIRIFVKGADVASALNKHRPVVKHAVRDIMSSPHTSIKRIEVYIFHNDYASMELGLNTIPAAFPIEDFNLKPSRKSIDLESIDEFLQHGVVLEAIEVNANNDLYLYGRQAPRQTLAGYPASLADLAVIYRSVFHYGNNAPYISLDQHEDNRFAKVNFGGHLQNTHAGSVVLEADKLFKSLGTGIDPNTHEMIRAKITEHVPDFLTEDERQLLENSGKGHTQIRYWFYPDSIGTVTDGSIGAILTHQFLADVERMDHPVSVGTAVRRTIDHLNQNYGQYESVFVTFRELSTVGRLMALVNWLQGMDMSDRVELAELLSVRIPAYTTPTRTKKMLAVTAIAYPERSLLTPRNVRDYSKIYYISHLLDQYSAHTSDERFLEIAGDFFSRIDASEVASPQYNEIQSKTIYYEHLIKENEAAIETFEERIRRNEYTLNRYDSRAVNDHNELVNEYNALLVISQSYIDTYNTLAGQLNSISIASKCITSVGGGINLRPSEFKRIHRSRNSPKIQEIVKIKNKIRTVGRVARSGTWMRSNAVNGGARINILPTNPWTVSQSSNGSVKYSYWSKNGNSASVVVLPDGASWQSEVSVQGYKDFVEYAREMNSLEVNHPGIGVRGTGRMSSNGKRIVFSK